MIIVEAGSRRPKNMWIRWIRIRNTAFMIHEIHDLGTKIQEEPPALQRALPKIKLKIYGHFFLAGSGSTTRNKIVDGLC
jgi:hypothetical protein